MAAAPNPAPSLADTPRERERVVSMPEVPAAPPPSAGSESKYVVWSSGPSDVPRSGPEDR
jgi:hypothetical protein